MTHWLVVWSLNECEGVKCKKKIIGDFKNILSKLSFTWLIDYQDNSVINHCSSKLQRDRNPDTTVFPGGGLSSHSAYKDCRKAAQLKKNQHIPLYDADSCRFKLTIRKQGPTTSMHSKYIYIFLNNGN